MTMLTHRMAVLLRSSSRRRSTISPFMYITRFQSTFVSKLGLGGHKWDKVAPDRYQQIVEKALEEGMTVLEAGQEGGDAALAKILKQSKELTADRPVTVTARVGYRTLQGADAVRLAGDVTVEKQKMVPKDDTTQTTDEAPPSVEVIHNISKNYILDCLLQSPLVQLRKEIMPSLDLVYMVHNPEVQTNNTNPDVLLEALTDSFVGLELGVIDGHISSFGVVSNGLALPTDHPLHLGWRNVVLEAASRAVQHVRGTSPLNISNLSAIQLPVNVLEPTGLQVAKELRHHLASQSTTLHLPKSLHVHAMRPLTCYPDRGTGTGHPIRMMDYPIPMEDKNVYTNELEGPPPAYQAALNVALSHFDGTSLLEAKEERSLTMEERETLDGCKLLQSMMHDLDVRLDTVVSFAAHEEELYNSVIPTIYGHFEELDEESVEVLQSFFSAYGLAVRHAIAKRTRDTLRKGGNEIMPYDIPADVRLQTFALQYLLREDAITKVIVGCSHPGHVVDAVNSAKKLIT